MGVILSKFRKKTSTLEVLTRIDQDITSIEEYKLHTQQRQKKIIGLLVVYSVIIFMIAASVFYFYYFPSTFKEQLLYITPLLVFPFIVCLLKQFLTWYYRRKIRKNENKLIKLKSEKEKILEDVMETETYKVAKEILEKFAPEQLQKTILNTPAMQRLTPVIGSNKPATKTAGSWTHSLLSQSPPAARKPVAGFAVPVSDTTTGLRRRIVSQLNPPGPTQAQSFPWPATTSPTPIGPSRVVTLTQKEQQGKGQGGFSGTRLTSSQHSPVLHANMNGQGMISRPSGPPMPRPVLPRERSYMDRLIDYLVADGPSNRYALICQQCESHNGMALKEEFEYIAFRCCYCYYWNPARKQRPQGPRLPVASPTTSRRLNDDSESSDEGGGEEHSDQSRESGSESAEAEDREEGIEAETEEGSGEVSGSDAHTESKEKTDSKEDIVDSASVSASVSGMGDSLAETGSRSDQTDQCNTGTGSKVSTDWKGDEGSEAEDIDEDKDDRTVD